jgi:protein O-mannosyl-transferase
MQPPEKKQSPFDKRDAKKAFCICTILVVVIWTAFGQTLRYQFINFDDNLYVYENPAVTNGLTLGGLESTFTRTVSGNWHPVTMISHMLDCQIYGLDAGGHHLTNVILHSATAILLFLVLNELTGRLWLNAFVAAVFAVHPLRVESVVWISERKDVLGGLFFFLTLGVYVRYLRKPEKTSHYLVVVVFFAMGLMCKPMLVTLPFVLLLLDYWPLNRFAQSSMRQSVFFNRFKKLSVPARLVIEKIPLLALSIISCTATILAQTDAIQPTERFSISLRICNAIVSYAVYIGQMFWPARLAVFYPLNAPPFWETGLALSFIVTVTVVVFLRRKQNPFLLVGWLWYLGMLVPVIGIIQVGEQAHADRYTYLPQIGLYLMLAYGAADLLKNQRHHRLLLGSLSVAIILVLASVARVQASYWKDSQTLWTHTLAETTNNHVAHNNLGNVLLKNGNSAEAILHYQAAITIQPHYAQAHYNLGTALFQQGDLDAAIEQFQKAIEDNPNYATAHNNLGNALLQKGRFDEAIQHYQKALEIDPERASTQNNLGVACLRSGRVDEAIVHFQKALEIKPGYVDAQSNLAAALSLKPQSSQSPSTVK